MQYKCVVVKSKDFRCGMENLDYVVFVMGTLKIDCKIIGTIARDNCNFVRLMVNENEIQLPIPVEFFYQLPFTNATISIDPKPTIIIEQIS